MGDELDGIDAFAVGHGIASGRASGPSVMTGNASGPDCAELVQGPVTDRVTVPFPGGVVLLRIVAGSPDRPHGWLSADLSFDPRPDENWRRGRDVFDGPATVTTWTIIGHRLAEFGVLLSLG